MRAVAIASILPLLVLGCSKQDMPLPAEGNTVLMRAHGSITSEIAFGVLDHGSGAAIPGAKVTYFSMAETVRLYEIKVMQRRGRTDLPPQPTGVTAITNAAGRAKLKCTFPFAKETHRSGNVDFGIYPGGTIRVEVKGYTPRALSTKEVFPDAPYSAMPKSAEILLKRAHANSAAEVATPAYFE